jgi:hypothetical protein
MLYPVNLTMSVNQTHDFNCNWHRLHRQSRCKFNYYMIMARKQVLKMAVIRWFDLLCLTLLSKILLQQYHGLDDHLGTLWPWSYGFITTYAISAYHHWCCECECRPGRGVQHYVIKFVSDLRQIGGYQCFMRTYFACIKYKYMYK